MEAQRLAEEEMALRAAVLSGDEGAWRILYDRHFEGLFAYLYARSGRDIHRTEELVQDCWLVAVRRIAAFNPGEGSFGAWLRGIAERELLNGRRRWARRLRLIRLAPPAEESVTPAPGAGERVALALSALSEPHRAVLKAKYEEQQSVAEIASAWGQSTKAIESLLTRARTAFREAVARLDGVSRKETSS